MGTIRFCQCGVVALALILAMCSSRASAQWLMMPDSAAANFRMVLFDSNTGALVNNNYFPLNGATNSTPIHAMQVGSEIWVSEQNGDRIARYDLSGTFLSQIGGGAAGGLDNIRGMEQVGDTIYVSNGGAGNGSPGANSVVMFDTTGANTGFFTTIGQAPSPFSVLDHQNGLLVGASSQPDDVHRYTYAGASLGTFHNSTLSFVEQLDHAHTGNVLAAVFTSGVIATLDANTGALISSFPASGARGVQQLGNGNIIWSNSAGVHVFNVGTQTSSLVYATSGGRYFDRVEIPEPGTAMILGVAALAGFRRRRAA